MSIITDTDNRTSPLLFEVVFPGRVMGRLLNFNTVHALSRLQIAYTGHTLSRLLSISKQAKYTKNVDTMLREKP